MGWFWYFTQYGYVFNIFMVAFCDFYLTLAVVLAFYGSFLVLFWVGYLVGEKKGEK